MNHPANPHGTLCYSAHLPCKVCIGLYLLCQDRSRLSTEMSKHDIPVVPPILEPNPCLRDLTQDALRERTVGNRMPTSLTQNQQTT